MKKTLLFLFLITVLFAGDDERVGQPIPNIFQAELLQAYNSVGFANLLKADAADLAAANPASIVNFKRIRLGMAFEYRTEIEWFSDIRLERPDFWYPVSAALVLPFKMMHVGFVYQNRYSKFMDFGDLEITTIEHPEGTGETISAYSRANVHSSGIIAGKDMYSLIFDGDRLAFAVELALEYLYSFDKIGTTSASFSDFTSVLKLGLVYNLSPAFGLGLLFETGPEFNGKFEYDSDLIYQNNLGANTYKMIFADKMALGFQMRPWKQISIATGWEYVFYEQIHPNNKNALNISFGVIYYFPLGLDLAVGMYNSKYRAKDSYLPNRDATFFNLGIRKRLPKSDIQIEVYDSHFYSGELREQTIIKLGFNVAL